MMSHNEHSYRRAMSKTAEYFTRPYSSEPGMRPVAMYHVPRQERVQPPVMPYWNPRPLRPYAGAYRRLPYHAIYRDPYPYYSYGLAPTAYRDTYYATIPSPVYRYTQPEPEQQPQASDNQRVLIPGDKPTEYTTDRIRALTRDAEASRFNTDQAVRAAEQAALGPDREIGEGRAYRAVRKKLDEANAQQARKKYVDDWSGDYKRSVDDIYNDLASDRYTDSRWQATKNWVARLFGSTDHEHQKTYKDWRGYTTEDADNSWRNGLWWMPDARDADLDKLRSEAYKTRGQDRVNLAKSYKAEREKYDSLGLDHDLLSQIPDKLVRRGFDQEGNVYKGVLERAKGGGATEGEFHAAANEWASKLLSALNLEPENDLFEDARERLARYAVQNRSDYALNGKTVPQILTESGMRQQDLQRLLSAVDLGRISQYTKSRLLGDKH